MTLYRSCRRLVGLVLAGGLVSGCLFTAAPVLDDSNSTDAAESEALRTFAARAARFDWFDASPSVPLPFWQNLTGRESQSLRVGPQINGLLVLQEDARGCDLAYCVVYYAVRVRADGVPELCLADTRKAEAMAALAVPDVTLENFSQGVLGKADLPPDIVIRGAAAAQRALIFRVFEAGLVTCEAGRPKG